MLSSALSQKDEEIELVHRLGHKEQGLEAQIRDIQDEAPSRRIQDCKREERALEAEIREVETKLWGLKSRHGHLLREIEQLENGVQAKLSSYRAALVLAKGETKAFLQHRQGSGGGGSAGGHYNAAVATRGGGGKGGRGTKEIGIWTLPAERRTLAMADEHFREEQEDLRARGQAAEQERLALEEGGLVWRDVVAEVTAVEDMLRTEMHGPEAEGRTTREEQQQQQQQLSLGNNEEAHDEGGEREGEEQRRGEKGGSSGGGGRRRDHGDSTKRVLRRMQHAKTALGEHLATAERRHWRLLVCCVGAELEALAEGMEVLTGGWDGGGGGEEGLKGGWDGGGEERLKRGWEEDDDDGGGGGGGGEEDLKRGWEGDDDGGDDGEGRLKRGWEGDDDDDDDDDDDGEGAGVEGDPGSGGERSEKGAGEENVFESVDRHGGFAAWG